MPENDKRNYEGLFLFGAAATANVDDALGTVRSFIEKHGGEILVLKKWDDRKLAYEVAKQTRGLYVLAYFAAPPNSIGSMEREVRLSDEVLRCLITDGSHVTVEEVEAMEPQRPEPREQRESDDEDRFDRRPPRQRREGGSREGREPREESAEFEAAEA